MRSGRRTVCPRSATSIGRSVITGSCPRDHWRWVAMCWCSRSSFRGNGGSNCRRGPRRWCRARPSTPRPPKARGRAHLRMTFGSEREGFRGQARREVLSVAGGYVMDEQRSMAVKDSRAARRVVLSCALRNEVQVRLQDHAVQDLVAEPAAEYGGPRYGELFLTRSRLGQGAFRVLVSEAYSKRCAITGESTFPVLEAAHIRPYELEGPHRISNGMLLRSDFHKLFDAGLVTVTPELRVRVSDRIQEQYFNGKAYYRLHDQPLAVIPKLDSQRPDPEFLRWHLTERFVG
ncbi:MAG: HNH endonuclease [Flavobacteriales bacterium]|nr:HNH endonuclease [Flavobacteriales bacterium]